MKTFQGDLKELTEKFRVTAPEAMSQIDRSIKELKKTQILEKGPKVGEKVFNFTLFNPLRTKKAGDKALNFSLLNALGEKVELKSLLLKGPVVLNFYRGGWCPFCNLELHALQKALPEFKALGAQLVAISPESPDNSLTTIEKKKLEFIVLSDTKNEVASSFGLIYSVPSYLIPVYHNFGADLSEYHLTGKFELPVPATYVIHTDYSIQYAFANEDFTLRPDIKEILQGIKRLKK